MSRRSRWSGHGDSPHRDRPAGSFVRWGHSPQNESRAVVAPTRDITGACQEMRRRWSCLFVPLSRTITSRVINSVEAASRRG
jgi:hypothetical protein